MGQCGASSWCGRLKDNPVARYHCCEMCQTESSSPDSPTVPDIWRREEETGRSEKGLKEGEREREQRLDESQVIRINSERRGK